MPQKPSPSQYPALTGQFMVDAPRGGVRVRRWPKKRGKPKSEAQARQVEWFRQASWFMKYLPAEFIQQAEILSHGTPLLTRDILMMAMAGRLYSFNLPGGKRWHPMAFIKDVSKSLDALSDTPGTILVRGPDVWSGLTPGEEGFFLKSNGPETTPSWAPASSSGSLKGSLERTTTLSISASDVIIPWQAAPLDQAAMWSAGDPTKITAPVPGWCRYDFACFPTNINFASNSQIRVLVNGAIRGAGSNLSSWSACAILPWIHLDAGDYIQTYFRHPNSNSFPPGNIRASYEFVAD